MARESEKGTVPGTKLGALWRQKSSDVLSLLKLCNGEKERCCKSVKVLHPTSCCAGYPERRRRREETGKVRAHPLSLYFAALLDLHMSDSPIVYVWGCNTPQEKTRKRYTIGYFLCGVSSGRLYISQGKQGPLSL